jgi:hypothetical protein
MNVRRKSTKNHEKSTENQPQLMKIFRKSAPNHENQPESHQQSRKST